jgi:chromosome segregation ATPase
LLDGLAALASFFTTSESEPSISSPDPLPIDVILETIFDSLTALKARRSVEHTEHMTALSKRDSQIRELRTTARTLQDRLTGSLRDLTDLQDLRAKYATIESQTAQYLSDSSRLREENTSAVARITELESENHSFSEQASLLTANLVDAGSTASTVTVEKDTPAEQLNEQNAEVAGLEQLMKDLNDKAAEHSENDDLQTHFAKTNDNVSRLRIGISELRDQQLAVMEAERSAMRKSRIRLVSRIRESRRMDRPPHGQSRRQLLPYLRKMLIQCFYQNNAACRQMIPIILVTQGFNAFGW